MNLSNETWNFIYSHANDDANTLALMKKVPKGVDLREAVIQIEARQIARHKLPSWFEEKQIIYPKKLSMEQCSSEPTAKYKAVLSGSGDTFVDLTGGLGADFSFIARKYRSSVYVERKAFLCRLAEHNFEVLGIDGTHVWNGDSMDYLRGMGRVDTILIDPARRGAGGGKVVAVGDCEPDISIIEDELVDKADMVIVKLSPMLDIRQALRVLRHVTQIHVVAVDNECKELLFVMKKKPDKNLKTPEGSPIVPNIAICCENILQGGDFEHFEFTMQEEDAALVDYSPAVYNFIYEPNATVMKAGAFKLLTQRYGVGKLHPNSHLYTSEQLVKSFPGRKLRVTGTSSFQKKELKKFLSKLDRVNIVSRNFSMKPEELYRKLKLRHGGSEFLYATTLSDGSKILIRAERA